MKEILAAALAEAWRELHEQGLLPPVDPARCAVAPARDPARGDFASNLALTLAKEAGLPARELAERLRRHLPQPDEVAAVEIAGPGFLNFRLRGGAQAAVIDQVLAAGAAYGRAAPGSGERVLLEYVSANPTGPLHVGHGRGAALGSCLAELLRAAGDTVECEYFVNDAGRQMDVLALSVWLRYLELCGEEVAFPAAGYQGDYVLDLAADARRARGEAWRAPFENLADGAPDDGPDEAGRNARLDALILRARDFLPAAAWDALGAGAAQTLLERIRSDLAAFGAEFDRWQSERELVEAGAVKRALGRLAGEGRLYEQDGAQWFRASEFGDDKDRVVRRAGGQWTYFAADAAYHAEKLARGYDRLINVWGADHHGYAPRLQAAVRALAGDGGARLEVVLVQFAKLYRGKEPLPMSTRAGRFETLQALQREVGRDAARFFYLLRGADQHLDFDLRLAVAQSADNPVYYVQYAHARICSVLAKLRAEGGAPPAGPCDLAPLTAPAERALQQLLARWPDDLARAARERAPHRVAVYLRELAQGFHAWYNAAVVLADDAALRAARLRLALAVRTVLAAGLGLLGVAAPERM